MLKLTLSLLLLVVAAAPALGATATGMFQSQNISLEVNSGVAFRAKSAQDKSDVLIVAVSNVVLNPRAIADYIDRRRLIEARIRNPEAVIIYLEFTPAGTYRGMSYTLAFDNECAFCATGLASTVKLTDGALRGKLSGEEPAKERAVAITLDVPVLTEDHGAALPADGGAPGKAYLAYHAAMVKGDRAAIREQLAKDQQAYWDQVEKSGQLAAWVREMTLQHPVKSVQISRGFAGADKAVLAIAGESIGGRVVGDVVLVREGDAWRVDDEVTEIVRR